MRKLKLIPLTAFFLFSFFTTNAQNKKREKEKESEEKDNPAEYNKQAFEMEKDPALGYVPYERLLKAIDHTEELKAASRSTTGRNINSPTPNLQSSPLTWIERGPIYDSVGPSNGNGRGGGTGSTAGGHTSGRIRAFLLDTLNDPTGNTAFTAGIAGGLWKTTNFLSTICNWTPINDRFSNLAISSICQDPTNPQVIYFSTGEPADNADRVVGGGVWKSTNGGTSFTWLPATVNFMRCFKIGCDATGNVYLACRTTTVPVNQQGGLFRSTNGGTTWADITPNDLDVANTGTSCTDFEITGSGILNAMFGYRGAGNKVQHRYTLTPTTVTPGTWSTSTGFRTSNAAAIRTEMAVLGEVLYAITINPAFNTDSCYKSVDGGLTWTKQNTTILPAGLGNGQGWYSMSLAINPLNSTQLISGGLDAYRSINSGSTWTKFTAWVSTAPYVHADHHYAQYWIVGGVARMILCTDGGVFYSADNGATFSSKNRNLGIKQFYSSAIHPTAGSNYLLAGAQDNGVHQLKNPGLSYSTEVTGGDGMIVHINQLNPLIQFGSYVFNDYRRSTNGGNTWSTVTLSSSQGLFVNPFDNDDAQNIMYCSNGPLGNLRRWTGNTAGSTNTTITIGALGAANSITSVKVSPYTANRIFIGSSTGKVFRIENANTITSATSAANTTDISGASFPAGTIVCVNTGTNDNNIIATYSNYGINNVWITTDGGVNWSAIDGDLPDMPVRWALFEPGSNQKIYLATEAGIYTTTNINGAATQWLPETTFPTVSTYMLKLRASDSTIVAGTHGRGLWTAKIFECTPGAIVTQPSNATVCNGDNASFTVTTSGDITSYQWQVSTNGGGTFNDIPAATSPTLNLTGVTTGMSGYQYHCVITPTCAFVLTTNNVILTVNPAPSATISYAGSPYCANAGTATVTRTGTAGGTYSSTAGLTLNAANGDVTLGTSTPGTYTVTYTIAASGGCPVFTTTTSITITATPAATISYAGSPYCQNAGTATVTRTGTAGGTYSSTAGLTLNAANGDVTLGTSTPGTYTVTYTIAAAGGCAIFTTTATITISPTPTVSPVPPNQTVCNNTLTAPVTFSGPVAGTTFNWVNNTPSIGLAASGTGNIAAFNAINISNVPVTATITVTPVTTSTGTVTFNYTGAVQSFVVPAGVTSVTIQAFGGQGRINAVGGVSVGGLGGSATGTLTVTPGQTLFINVGGGAGTGITGGFNGGGNAGANAGCANAQGGGGGGASDVRITSNTLANRVIVGAGGGGAGGNRVNGCGRGAGGGGGGGLYGGGGGAGWPGIPGGQGPVPTGGTQVAGGAGGQTTFSPGPTNGFPGVLGIGGNGGTEIGSAQGGDATAEPGGIGGGLTGGNGLYNQVNNWCGQSGAGGSSYIGGVTSGSTSSGVRSGNGMITISYASGGPTCTGPSVSFTITVNPSPNAVATPASQTICSANAITTIVLSSSLAGTTYAWTRDNVATATGIAASGSGNISGTLTNITNAPVTVTFTIIPTANGCAGAAITATVLVNPTPNASAAPASQTICSGSAITPIVLTSTTTGANVILNGGFETGSLPPWTIISSNPAPVVNSTAPHTGTKAAFLGNLPGPEPLGDASIYQQFTVPASGGTLSYWYQGYTEDGITFDWQDAYITNTSNTILATIMHVCTTNAYTQVNFNMAPYAGQTVRIQFLVHQDNFGDVTNMYVDDVTLAPAPVITYNWTRDNNATVTGIAASGSGTPITGTLTNTTFAPVTVTFTITPTSNGCIGTPTTATVLVNPTPNAIATPSSQTICSGTAITPIVLTSSVTGTTYAWTRNNTATVTGIAASGTGNISGSLTNTTTAPVTVTFTITPTANGCAGPPITATVIVQAPLLITCPGNITVPSIIGGCTAVVTYAPVVTGTPAPTFTYTLSGATTGSGNGTGSGLAFNVGVTTVTITATNSCSAVSCSFTITVTDSQLPVVTTPPANTTVCVGSSATFSVVSTNTLSYQWQSWNGSAWVNIAGATTSTLTLNGVTFSMNTNSYRIIVTGLCSSVTSVFGTLYVNQLPTVSILASRPPVLLPTQTLTLTAVVSPAGGTYQWFKNGVAIVGATASTLSGLTVDDVGTYTVRYTDANGCVQTSAGMVVSSATSGNIYLYPNPNTGQFQIRFNNAPNEKVTVNIYDAKGAMVYRQTAVTTTSYTSIQINISNQPSGTYVVTVIGEDGRLIGARRAVVTR